MSRLVRRWAAIILAFCLCLTLYYKLHQSHLQFGLPALSSSQHKLGPIDWRGRKEFFPVTTFVPVPLGGSKDIPRIQTKFPTETEDRRAWRIKRQQEVKSAFVKSWKAYEKYAWLQDEVTPISGQSKQTFGGWGATLVDSLDSLLIFGLGEEAERAINAVKGIDFTRASHGMLNVFETTIRYLGGMLSAYDLSDGKYPLLLDKATELGDMLYAAFDTPNRMPICRWYWEK